MAYELAKHAKLPRRWFPGSTRTSFVKVRPAVYRTAMEIFMDIRDTYRKKSDVSERDLLRFYRDASLLVIDEVQERGETPFEDRKLTHIVDGRYADCRPTIIIGNYTREEFGTNLSPSIIDRIRENGGGVNFDWSSYRDTPKSHVP